MWVVTCINGMNFICFRKFGNSGKWCRNFPAKVFRNSGNCWISEMQTIQPKITEIPGAKLNGKKTSAKKKIENLGISREVVLFYGNFGKYCSIRYWKLPKIRTGCLGWMEGAQLISGQITYLNCKCTARIETDCNFKKNGPRFSRLSSCVVKKWPRTEHSFFPFDRITGVFLVEFQKDDWNYYIKRVPLTVRRKKNK